ncbi:MAG: hypothetical protein IKC28_05145 [Clostridia bacterium]|nr:hypothetical protein [Clostridia bacterium]
MSIQMVAKIRPDLTLFSFGEKAFQALCFVELTDEFSPYIMSLSNRRFKAAMC